MLLLIDADFIAYKACAGAEIDVDYGDNVIVVSSRFSDAQDYFNREIERIKNYFAYFDELEIGLYFSSADNFRKKILPEYKGHRNRKKPCGYKRLIEDLKNEYTVIQVPTLEADDAMGVAQTITEENDTIIVSPDKDMRQIPGYLYDFKEVIKITEEEGRRFHLLQTLAGDSTDGYAGCPGYGMKKAEQFLSENDYSWKAIVEAFEEKGLTEEDALTNARLAKILTADYYDFDKREPILWTASPSDGADDGAEPAPEKADRSATTS